MACCKTNHQLYSFSTEDFLSNKANKIAIYTFSVKLGQVFCFDILQLYFLYFTCRFKRTFITFCFSYFLSGAQKTSYFKEQLFIYLLFLKTEHWGVRHGNQLVLQINFIFLPTDLFDKIRHSKNIANCFVFHKRIQI